MARFIKITQIVCAYNAHISGTMLLYMPYTTKEGGFHISDKLQLPQNKMPGILLLWDAATGLLR